MDNASMRLKYFRIAGRYLNLFLFDPLDFLNALSKKGYMPLAKLSSKPFKGKIGVAGPIAKKSSIIVDINTEKGIIGLLSPDISMVLEEFNEIEKVIEEDLMINLRPYFYEVLVEIEIFSEDDPLRIFKNISRNIELIRKISDILNHDSQVFGIRICSANSVPDSPNWFDIEIIPAIEKPSKAYHVYIVFRNTDKNKIYDFCSNLEYKVKELISTLTNFASQN